MFRVAASAAVLLILSAGFVRADEDEKTNRSERRLINLERRARKIASLPESDDPAGFLFRETQRLIERSRPLARPSYEFERMLEALDDLLDAREELVAASRANRPAKDRDESRADTAKRLERSYFRLQQGEYFARLSGDKQASEYVSRSRRLYQKGRAAYDAQDYYRANKLASASSELVNVLENLAQAKVRRPDPPVLE
jgi:hypothetical protein